jgi:hypothetical protein
MVPEIRLIPFYAGPLFSISDGKMDAKFYVFYCTGANTHLLIIAIIGTIPVVDNLKGIVS